MAQEQTHFDFLQVKTCRQSMQKDFPRFQRGRYNTSRPRSTIGWLQERKESTCVQQTRGPREESAKGCTRVSSKPRQILFLIVRHGPRGWPSRCCPRCPPSL